MKRILSFAMALVMLFGLMPIPAGAEEAREAAAPQETVAESLPEETAAEPTEPPAAGETEEETEPPETEETQPSEPTETEPEESEVPEEPEAPEEPEVPKEPEAPEEPEVPEESEEPEGQEASEILTWEDYCYALLEDGTVSIRGFTGTPEDADKPFLVKIPGEIQGVAVTEIAEKAFAGNDTIHAVLLPETIQTIGSGAFEDCENLKVIAFCGEAPSFEESFAGSAEKLEKILILDGNDFTELADLLKQDLGEEKAGGIQFRSYASVAALEGATTAFLAELSTDTQQEENTEITTEEEKGSDNNTYCYFAGGVGSADDPYQVSNATQLDAVRQDMTANYIQIADIDLAGLEWNPIGWMSVMNEEDYPFKGTYDGNGHVIKNMRITQISQSNSRIGLFAHNEGMICNVHLEDIDIRINANREALGLSELRHSGYLEIGGLVGRNYKENGTNLAIVEGCSVSGTVYADAEFHVNVGGIIGFGRCAGCTNYANIDVSYRDFDNLTSSGGVGGITGHSGTISGYIEKCVNYGNVCVTGSGNLCCGGISGEYGTIANCVNYGNISGISSNHRVTCSVGGITGKAGTAYSSGAKNCVNLGDISAIKGCEDEDCRSGGACRAGGIAATIDGYINQNQTPFLNCYNLGEQINADLYLRSDTYEQISGRVIGQNLVSYGYSDGFVNDCYSVDSTRLNGSIPTQTGPETKQGGTMRYAEICRAIRDILIELGLPTEEVTPKAEEVFNNHKYALYDLSMTWTEAKAYCEDLGGHLATITSAEEQAFIESFLPEPYTKRQYWLGATFESGSWEWVTGETFEYTNWDRNQPDHQSGEEFAEIFNCSGDGGAYPATRYKWNDITHNNVSGSNPVVGADAIGFICEYDSLVPGYVRYFSSWDEENQIAYFGPGDMLGSQVTEETDVSFTENPTALLGQYVLVETKPRTDGDVGPDILIRVKAVESKTGTVTAADATSVTIDSETYSTPLGMTQPESFVDQFVLYHLYNGRLVEVEILETIEGTLISWDAQTRVLNVNLDGAAKNPVVYTLSPLADADTLSRLNSGSLINSQISYTCDCSCLAYHVESADSKSGKCGDNLWWTLGNDGTLTISGTGNMIDYTDENYAPWFRWSPEITSVVINEGVTSIGNYAFAGGSSVGGEYVHWSRVTIPSSITSVGEYAFLARSEDLKVVYYGGTVEQWKALKEKVGSTNEIFSEAVLYNGRTIDVWSFANSVLDYGDEAEGYFITSNDYEKLISPLSNADKEEVKYKWGRSPLHGKKNYNIDGKSTGYIPWAGSCYGMSSWVCLNSYGIRNAYDIDGTSNYLHSFTLSPDVESAINFYHFQQRISKVQSKEKDFLQTPQDDQLSILKELALSGKIFRISFDWYPVTGLLPNFLNPQSHAVVGYGWEEIAPTTISVNGTTYSYNNRILIYDCAAPSQYEDFNLYFNNDGIWCIPGYDIVSTQSGSRYSIGNNGRLALVTSDPAVINTVDYITGELSSGAQTSFQSAENTESATLSTDSAANYTVLWGDNSVNISGFSVEGENKSGIVVSLDAMIMADGQYNGTTSTAFLPDDADNYTVKSNDNMSFVFRNNNYFTGAAISSPGTMTFSQDGMVSIDSENTADFYLDIVANEGCFDLPWYKVEISSTGATEIATEKSEDGVVISGDHLADVTIRVSNDSGETEIEISSSEESILLTQSGDEPAVFEDTDGDGVYEKQVISCVDHLYDSPVFSWDDDCSCIATFACTACGFVQTVNCTVTLASIPATATEAAKIAYTATVTFNGKTYTDIKEIPKSSIQLERDYLTLPVGSSTQLSVNTASDALLDMIEWTAEGAAGSGTPQDVIQVEADGTITAQNAGTAYVVASVTIDGVTYSDRCRVDVTVQESPVAVQGVQLGKKALTTELFKTDYASFDVLLLLKQNETQSMTADAARSDGDAPENNGVAVTSARFEDETMDGLFRLAVKDDRTLLVVPRKSAVDNPKSVAKSYSGRVIVNVEGREFTTDGKLTLTVKKTMPKLKAATLTFNSFYPGETKPIAITGGTVTGILRNSAKDTGKTTALPKWLTLSEGVLTLTGDAPEKSASGSVYVLAETEEWAIPIAVTVPVKLVYKAPGLKLSASSVTLAKSGSAGVGLKLLCTGKADTLNGLKVSGIQAPEGFEARDFDPVDGSFTLVPMGELVPGDKQLVVSFGDTAKTVKLKLKVRAKAVTLSAKPTTVTLNAGLEDSAVIPLTVSPADYRITAPTFRLTDSSGASTNRLVCTYADGAVTIQSNDDTESGATYKLYICVPGSKEIAVTVKTFAEKNSTPTLSAKVAGAIDLSFPESYAAVSPSFRSYNSGKCALKSWNITASKSKTEPWDATDDFALEVHGGAYRFFAKGNLTPENTYTLSMTFSLSDGSTYSCSGKLPVKRTAVKLKLSKTSLSLNNSVMDSATVDVSCLTKNYDLQEPVISGPENLNVIYSDGQLSVSVNAKTEYGATYRVSVKATQYDAPATLTVKIPAENKSAVTATLKAAGQLDVIRDSTAITVMPTYKNCLREPNAYWQMDFYSSADGYTNPVNSLFHVEKNDRGSFVITRAAGSQINPKLKYRAVLTSKFVDVTVVSAPVALKVTAGSAKIMAQTTGSALYAADKNSRADFRLIPGDARLNGILGVRIKNQNDRNLFELFDYGNGVYAIGFWHGEVDQSLMFGKTSLRIPLEVTLDGNGTPGASVAVTLNVALVPYSRITTLSVYGGIYDLTGKTRNRMFFRTSLPSAVNTP